MLLLHPHYILLHPLYTCPALFGLMLLHIFLIFLKQNAVKDYLHKVTRWLAEYCENGLHWLV